MMNKSRYYTKTAFMGIVNNRLMSISSILTIGCCLFLFSVFLLFTLNINSIGEQIKSQCEIQAYIDMSIDGDAAYAIQDEIDKISNVSETVFETKAEAFENYAEQLGGNSIALEGLEGEDFLRNSVKIKLHDLALAQQTADEVSNVEGVAEVINHQDTVDNVLNVTTYIQSASFIIMLIPFIIEGVLIGFLGSLLALLVTYLGYIPLYTSVTEAFSLLKLCSPASITGLLVPLVIAFGCVMGALASTVSTTRHLKV